MKAKERDLNKCWKGNSGEFLIEELLKRLDFQVFRFGVEKFLWKLIENELGENDVKNKVLAAPDFIAVDKKNNVLAIEVKFWPSLKWGDKNGIVKREAEKYKKYFSPETILVFITDDEHNPFIACKVSKCEGLQDFKNFIEYLDFEKTEDNLAIVKELEKFAISVFRVHEEFNKREKSDKLFEEKLKLLLKKKEQLTPIESRELSEEIKKEVENLFKDK